MSVAHVLTGILSYGFALGFVSLFFKGSLTRRQWFMMALALAVALLLGSVYDRVARALGIGDVARFLILAVVCGASVGVGYWRSRRRRQEGRPGVTSMADLVIARILAVAATVDGIAGV